MTLGELRDLIRPLTDECEVTVMHRVVNKAGVVEFHEQTKATYQLVDGEGIVAIQTMVGVPYYKRLVVLKDTEKEDRAKEAHHGLTGE